jgi:hypothetical protein
MHAVLQSPFINNTDHQTTNRMLNFNDRKSPSLTKLKPVPPPPPPYAPPTQIRSGPANMSNLPINVLHRIIAFTLDSKATPSRFMGDDEEERVRRIFQLFYGLRGVDRRFYLSTSVESRSNKGLRLSINVFITVNISAIVYIIGQARKHFIPNS